MQTVPGLSVSGIFSASDPATYVVSVGASREAQRQNVPRMSHAPDPSNCESTTLRILVNELENWLMGTGKVSESMSDFSK